MDTKPGQSLDPQMLDADLRRLYGTGDFEHVNYRIIEEPGKRVLAVDAVEKSWGPNYLRFGLGFSSDFKGDNFFFSRSLFVKSSSFCSSLVSSNLSARAGPAKHATPARHRHARTAKYSRLMTLLHGIRVPVTGRRCA